MTQTIHATLVGHPDNPRGFVERVAVTLLQKADGSLMLSYSIHGPIAKMRIPSHKAPAPAEALWQTTCCEFFVAAEGASGYREFNFSPSGQWATHDFASYRRPLTDVPPPPAPLLWSRHEEGNLRLDVSLMPSALPAGRHLRCALAVIVEETPQKAARGMGSKAHGAQDARHINQIGEHPGTAQRSRPPAQQFIQRFLKRHDGQLGFWALAHPEGKPDFHHPAGFTLVLNRTA